MYFDNEVCEVMRTVSVGTPVKIALARGILSIWIKDSVNSQPECLANLDMEDNITGLSSLHSNGNGWHRLG